jgi:hypothetical protein
MNTDVDLDVLLHRWQVASAALADAEARDPYSYEVDEIADEVIAAKLALTQAGVRDIIALAAWAEGQRDQLTAHAAVLENALK